ncbi:methyltransferase domain-containing protein [Oxynema sp. CENA135]|uniref:class I SAM-dependent methyltransferase n=1 Tax=Oxynema sp. CENA135 TaxID=984206 RepID=UPI00190CFB64|nr:methyltransferase domain-containing protein [Oxynema sp. CENA135]MBK4728693.1 methyltransferase domain-containing protein [Oxynema sp. CENA135]
MKVLKQLISRRFIDRYRPQWNQISLETKIILAKIKRQFLRPPFPQCKEINLHLGCGKIDLPNFINIDGLPGKHIHYIRSLDDLRPFKDNTIDLVYASHCLEHFSHKQTSRILAEWFRVLKNDGILRISVPDFELLLNIYRENENNLNTILDPLMGGQDYKFNFHMTAFNYSSLELLLKKSGFRQVQKWQPESCEFTTFDDWSNRKVLVNEKYYPVSLNVQAIK